MALDSFCITYHNHTSESNSNLGPFLPRKTLRLLKVVFYHAGGAGDPHINLIQIGKGSENTVGVNNLLILGLRLMEINPSYKQEVL